MQLKTKVVVGTGLAGLALAAYVSVIAATKFVPNDQPVGYIGQPAVSNINVASGNEWMYSIDYSYKDWSGNLHSYNITKQGTVGTLDRWGTGGASEKVLAQAQAGTRNIVTLNSAGNGGVAFKWSDLSAAQRTLIDPAATEAMVNYLRGDKTNEGTGTGKFRVRAGGLGDIIHSTPQVTEDAVGNKTIFIGANDGMLHAIDAVDGSERFAYVPGAVLGKLKLLTDPAYEHQYYVDGRMDHMVYSGKRILVGTLGAGGKAVFGLDVTNLSAMTEAKAASLVKWEVSNTTSGFGDLGYTYGAPTLTNLGEAAPSKSVYPALVMGNGYSNSGTGRAVLYLINPLTGALLHAFDTEEGTTDAPNGLSAPSLWDLNKDGVKDVAYAGDLNGNLWRFSLAKPYTKPTKLHSGSGGAYAITMAPAVSYHPQGGAMVSFVTGRILTKLDMTDTSVHSAYGIWDGAPSQNNKILVQTLTEAEFGSTNKIRVRKASDTDIDFRTGQHRGWRTELPTGGERVIGDGAYTTAGVFQFMSHNPTVNPSSTPPGENWWMQLDALSGGAVGRVIFDLNADGAFNSQDHLTSGEQPVGRFMGGGVRSQLVALSVGKNDVFHSNFDRNGAPGRDSSTSDTITVGGERGVTGGHFDTDYFCYQNCGRFQSNKERFDRDWDYRNRNDDDGFYSVGYGQDNAGGYLNYIHVHEYDDIYDTVGLNMLNPSQDLQRLNLARATFVATHTPNTPKHIAESTMPSSTTLVSKTTTEVTQQGTPTPSITYSSTLPDVVGTPVTGTNNGSKTITTTTSYKTTATYVYPQNAVSYRCGRNTCWRYDSVREVRTWNTSTVTVDTITNVRFKVLMANQAYSPAVKLSVEGDVANSSSATFNDSVLKYQTGSTLSAASLPVYEMNSIKKLMWSMPLDAFNEKDWAGTGDVRTGLHPIQPPCAGVNTRKQTLGGGGEWRNGALTVQVVQDDITDADIERNHATRPDLGYRLKPSSQASKLVAEYLIYWHHPNALCHGAAGFDSTPGADTTPEDAKPGKPAFGAADPAGEFKTVPGTKLETPKDPPPTVVQNQDGSTTTTTVTYKELAGGNGFTKTTTVTTTYPSVPGGGGTGIVTGGAVNTGTNTGGGTPPPAGPDPAGITRTAASEGRLNWRELRK